MLCPTTVSSHSTLAQLCVGSELVYLVLGARMVSSQACVMHSKGRAVVFVKANRVFLYVDMACLKEQYQTIDMAALTGDVPTACQIK